MPNLEEKKKSKILIKTQLLGRSPLGSKPANVSQSQPRDRSPEPPPEGSSPGRPGGAPRADDANAQNRTPTSTSAHYIPTPPSPEGRPARSGHAGRAGGVRGLTRFPCRAPGNRAPGNRAPPAGRRAFKFRAAGR